MNNEAPIQLPLSEAMGLALEQAQNGRASEALYTYGEILKSDPGNATALTNAGIIRCQMGDIVGGAADLEKALSLDPRDEGIKANLITAYRHITGRWDGGASREQMIAATRRLIALRGEQDMDRLNLESLLSYSDARAALSDYEPIRTPDDLGRTILIACMPKSGSTWLVNALQAVSGFSMVHFANAFVENEQELYLPAVRRHAGEDNVVQQHCRASGANIHLIQAYGMTPVVLVRNLFDTLISMRDFWDAGAVRNSYLYPDWPSLDQETKHEALVRHLAPWYVQFYVSWAVADRKGDVELEWVRYEDMIPDKPATLRRIAEFCGLSVTDGQIDAAISAVDGDKAKTRFNKGVAGRGEKAFTPAQMDMVRELTRPFPSIDFSPIGL